MRLVRGNQKLQTANFRCTPRAPKEAGCMLPPHFRFLLTLLPWVKGGSKNFKVGFRVRATMGNVLPPLKNLKLDLELE